MTTTAVSTTTTTESTNNQPLWTWSYLLICLGIMSLFASQNMLAPLLPFKINQLDLTQHLGMIVSSFMVASLLTRPWAGKWCDEIGPRILMFISAALFAIGSMFYPLCNVEWQLYAITIVQGSMYAMFYTASGAYLMHILPANRHAEGIGHFSNSMKIAMAFSPALALLLLNQHHLIEAFWLSAAMSIAAFACVLGLKPVGASEKNKPIRQGKLLNTKALFPGVVMITNSMAYGALIPFFPLFAAEKHVLHPGWFYTCYAVFLIASRAITGKLSDKYGRDKVLIPGLSAVALTLLMLTYSNQEPLLWLSASVYGLAAGTVQPSLMALAVSDAKPDERGSAVATFTMCNDTGIALGSFVMGTLGPAYSYTTALLWVGISAAFGLCLYLIKKMLFDENKLIWKQLWGTNA